MIRAATTDDLPVLVDVAAGSRFAHQAWEPSLWGMTASDHAVQPLLLGAHLDDPRTVTLLVASGDEPPRGWIRATASPGGSWVVEEFAVERSEQWHSVGRVLLAAVAARAASAGAERLDLPCPRADQPRRAMLADAGLRLTARVAHRVPTGSSAGPPPPGVRALDPGDRVAVEAFAPAAPHAGDCLGPVARSGRRAVASLVVDDGATVAAAAVRRVRRFALTNVASRVAIAEPAECRSDHDWADAGDRLLAGIERVVDEAGEPHLLVPCDVGAEAKSAALAARGYAWPIEVWRLEPPHLGAQRPSKYASERSLNSR